ESRRKHTTRFFLKQKRAYEIETLLEFRRVLFRSGLGNQLLDEAPEGDAAAQLERARQVAYAIHVGQRLLPGGPHGEAGVRAHRRSEERRVGKRVDLGGRRVVEKKTE